MSDDDGQDPSRTDPTVGAINLPDGTEVQVELRAAPSEFWANLSAEELARRQKVEPIKSLDDLAGDWPIDDSLDELLDLVRKVRR